MHNSHSHCFASTTTTNTSIFGGISWSESIDIELLETAGRQRKVQFETLQR